MQTEGAEYGAGETPALPPLFNSSMPGQVKQVGVRRKTLCVCIIKDLKGQNPEELVKIFWFGGAREARGWRV
jgi:hypothetical protein